MSKKLGSILILSIITIIIFIGYRYIHYRTVHAVSDAAFIKSNRLSTLSFKISGKVVKMYKEANEALKRGELLAEIEPIDFITTKKKLEYKLKALEQKIESNELKRDRLNESLKLQSRISHNNIEAIRQNIASLAFKIDSAQVNLSKLDKDVERFYNLLTQKLIASEKYETIKAQRDSLLKSIEAMKKALDAQKEELKRADNALKLSKLNEKQILEIDKGIASMIDEKKALESAIESVKHKISYTKLYAPFDGVVAKKFFDAPKVVSKGYPVYAVVDPKDLYCEVLLSEKKLRGVRVGNSVKVTVDAVEGREYQGVVESISPTSASTFSLVPRDIASGEFTKLDQRFVVRIKLNSIKDLRAGMGATVAIDRKSIDE